MIPENVRRYSFVLDLDRRRKGDYYFVLTQKEMNLKGERIKADCDNLSGVRMIDPSVTPNLEHIKKAAGDIGGLIKFDHPSSKFRVESMLNRHGLQVQRPILLDPSPDI